MNSLPKTDSISELAKFWDNHDLTDFEAELDEVTEPVFQPKTQVAVFLPPADVRLLHKMATTQQLSEAELIASWIHERVKTG